MPTVVSSTARIPGAPRKPVAPSVPGRLAALRRATARHLRPQPPTPPRYLPGRRPADKQRLDHIRR